MTTPEVAVSQLQRAKDLFPLNFDFRMGPSAFYSQVRWSGSYRAAAVELAGELVENPYAADLRRNLIGFLVEAHQVPEAQMHAKLLRVQIPVGPIYTIVGPGR